MATSLFSTIEQVSGRVFDVVIVGCALAARLTEKSNITVLVLEAGPVHQDDVNIDTPAVHFHQLRNPQYDWMFQTSSPRNMHGHEVWSRGKGLGGTSNMNGMMWTRPGREEIDAWEQLGNPGWNYDNFIKYVKRAENFHPPTKTTIARDLLSVDPDWFGTNGPIHISYADSSTNAGPIIRETVRKLGIPLITDPINGKYCGTWTSTTTIDPVTLSRSTSFKGYILPNLDRENLFVLPNAFVTRILLDDAVTEPVTAKGVEFKYGNQLYTVMAAREFIVSAGTLQSPQILELSGIGDPAILEPLGIPVRVILPAVGTNLQEHGGDFSICFEIRPESGIQSLDLLSDPAFSAQHLKLYQEKLPGSLLASALSCATFLSLEQLSGDKTAETITRHEKCLREMEIMPEGLKHQYEIQLERLRNPNMPIFEIVINPCISTGKWFDKAEPGKSYVSFILLLNNPFSRGTLHISSPDPFVQGVIHPNDLACQIDAENMLAGFKFARSLAQHEPFKGVVAKEVSPGPSVSSDEDIIQHLKDSFSTAWHTVGTSSMLPREKGGVVDPRLKVYGTTNIRVVDISIIPLHVSVHPQCMAYGIGEKAADIILEDFA
ncbi:GMC oxidoreductase [Sphaerobolus stellatus SS14]|nr:GMC oxidoreductase [Sphaerobolus stellatus SS14]